MVKGNSSLLSDADSATLIGFKDTLTLMEAAVYTGLSKSHLYTLCSKREIPYYKGAGGKFTYFDKSELDKWMRSVRVATRSEIESDAVAYCVTGENVKK